MKHWSPSQVTGVERLECSVPSSPLPWMSSKDPHGGCHGTSVSVYWGVSFGGAMGTGMTSIRPGDVSLSLSREQKGAEPSGMEAITPCRPSIFPLENQSCLLLRNKEPRLRGTVSLEGKTQCAYDGSTPLTSSKSSVNSKPAPAGYFIEASD